MFLEVAKPIQLEKPFVLVQQAKAVAHRGYDAVRPHLPVAVAALAIALFVVAAPAHATSFSLDMGDMMNSAADIFNGLWPAFAIVVGLGLGVQILRFIVSAVKAAF